MNSKEPVRVILSLMLLGDSMCRVFCGFFFCLLDQFTFELFGLMVGMGTVPRISKVNSAGRDFLFKNYIIEADEFCFLSHSCSMFLVRCCIILLSVVARQVGSLQPSVSSSERVVE